MAEPEEQVEPLHLELEDREVYLAKIPGMLTVNPSTLEDDIPTEYRVEISETPLKLKVFSLDGSGRMAIEGTVKNSCSVMAQRNDQYSKMCKQRLIKSMVKTRIVQPLEDLPRVKKARIQFTIEKPDAEAEEDDADSKLMDKSDKKIKMSKDELKNLVFHHFEEREYWPLKELNYHCRQPESLLKEVLKEICVYHRKGPNKSCYELKPQYKDGVSSNA
ncbi:Transcription initiation factor IIF subunit beta [Phytophthora nicotianae]|uniref:Enoyl-CoA delta isomerase 2 n=1 Tax=Phytophthora nicotianae TaxID=4792 RepID=A0A0W8BVW2_PHYNI|nr:Transcription initiation factor IIF subunit beta [Phytophthora nicotianae]KUF98808.1 Enoyl-CoA delta isomerase 2 [Phytophthora nicotianae]